jgi:hypothetical protein
MKTMKNLSQNSRSSSQDLNTRLPEYEAGMLTTRPRDIRYFIENIIPYCNHLGAAVAQAV